MTLDQLRVFLAVAERGHVTKAAEVLGLSQSAASAAIKALEEHNDVRLFNRVGRRIELSQAGLRFLPAAKIVVEAAEVARHTLENVSQTISGSISIAASQTIASYWLPRRLALFHRAHPAVRLNVTIGNTRYVETSVLEGIADIGLVEGRTESDLLRRVRVDVDRLVLVVAKSHPQVPRAAGGDPDIRSVNWIIRERGSGTREALEDLARVKGLSLEELKVFLVLPSNESVCQVVAAGAGATIISELVVRKELAEGSLRKLPLELPKRDFALIAHRDRHAGRAQASLKHYLRDAGS